MLKLREGLTSNKKTIKEEESIKEINLPRIDSIRTGTWYKVKKLLKTILLAGTVVGGGYIGGEVGEAVFDDKVGKIFNEKLDPEKESDNLINNFWDTLYETKVKLKLLKPLLPYGRTLSQWIGILFGLGSSVSILIVILKSPELLKPSLKQQAAETSRQLEIIKNIVNQLVRKANEAEKTGKMTPELSKELETIVPEAVEKIENAAKKLELSPPDPNREAHFEMPKEKEKELVEVKKGETPKKAVFRRNPNRP